MDTSGNMAYGMTAINRERSSSDHDYDVITNPYTGDPPPTLPRRVLGEEGEASYEVSTPPKIRQMREQQKALQKEGAAQDGDEDKELYTQIPSSI